MNPPQAESSSPGNENEPSVSKPDDGASVPFVGTTSPSAGLTGASTGASALQPSTAPTPSPSREVGEEAEVTQPSSEPSSSLNLSPAPSPESTSAPIETADTTILPPASPTVPNEDPLTSPPVGTGGGSGGGAPGGSFTPADGQEEGANAGVPDSSTMSGQDSPGETENGINPSPSADATTYAPTVTTSPGGTGTMVTPGVLVMMVNLTTAGTLQEQSQVADVLGQHLAGHAGVDGAAALLVSVFMQGQGGGHRYGRRRALNVLQPNVTSARCALAATKSTEGWVTISLEKSEPALVQQLLEQVVNGDVGLYTADGVSLRDLICRVSTTSSLVAYDHAAIPSENAKRWKRRSLPASAATGIVVCLLAIIFGLMLGIYADRQRNASRQRGRSSAVTAYPPRQRGRSSAVIALPASASTGAAAMAGGGDDDAEGRNEGADSDDEDDIWNLFWMAE